MKKLAAILCAVFMLQFGTTAAGTSDGQRFVKIHATHYASYALREDGTAWKWGDGLLLPARVHQSDLPEEVSQAFDDALENQSVIEIDYEGVPGFDPEVVTLRDDGILRSTSAGELIGVKDFDAYGSIVEANGAASGMTAPIRTYTLVAVKEDGTAWKATDRSGWTQIEGLAEIEAVSIARSHYLALDKNGSVWAWGDNEDGQLGNGFSTEVICPIQVAKVRDAVSVVAQAGRTGVVKGDGFLYYWETPDMQDRGIPYFTESELRTSDAPYAPEPLVHKPYEYQLPDAIVLDEVGYEVQFGVFGGSMVSAALTEGGAVWFKDYSSREYVLVDGLTDIISIRASSNQIYALRRDGTVWSIQHNREDDKLCRQIETLTDVKAIACGSYDMIALKNDGTVFVNGTKISQLDHVISVDAAFSISQPIYGSRYEYTDSYYCALKDDGTVWVWGDNSTEHLRNMGNERPSKIVMAKAMYRANDPMLVMDGVAYEIDPGRNTVPIFVNNRTLLPIRSLVERLGGSVVWHAQEQRVEILLDSTAIELCLGRDEMLVNGETRPIGVSAVAINERTYLPLRAIAESLGFDVEWNGDNGTILLYEKDGV